MIAVTGGDGFIGSAVRRLLTARKIKSKSLDRSTGVDVRDFEAVLNSTLDCSGVIHLAGVLGTAELFDTPWAAVDVNVGGTLNVLEACKTNGLAYVGIGMPDVFPSLYTATKVAAIRMARAYHHAHGVPVSHVTAYNAFGPGQKIGDGHPQKIIPTFARNAWRGVPLPVWGSGEQTVDLIHTDDIARMLVDALKFGDGQFFDAGTGVGLTVLEVADMVRQVVGRGEVEFLPMRAGEVETKVVASGQGWDLLGWKPEFRMPQFIETVGSYR